MPGTAVTLFPLQALHVQYVLQQKAIPLSILDTTNGPISGINWT